ncbi:MAG: phosphate ABC transporter permease PstA [Phycisphaerales bacterium]|nr:phosphate ABC transporter permease PstA [Phycisphaerales bacterium]
MPLVRKNPWKTLQSRVMFAACAACTVLIIGVLGLVTVYLFSIGFGATSWEFFAADPTGNALDPGGMRNAVVGTLILIGLASLIGIPLGLLAGVYLSEYGTERLLPGPVRFVTDVLAGVPSIVVGILGYELLVVPLGNYSGWAGAGALAFIMVPIVARTSEEMFRLVPDSYRQASAALGATRSQTILRVVAPAAAGTVVTGIMLAIARIAGETAPLLFTALGSRFLTTNPSEPFPSLTVQVYTYATGPYPAQRELAWAGILVLISIIFVVNVSIRLVTLRVRRSPA